MSTGIIAVADLGSNSFKLEIAQVKNGRPKISERIRKNVKLGGGVGPTNMLTKPAMRAGWEALAEFGDRLTGFDPKNVKVIATQTLRSVKNAAEFLELAQYQLGFDIDVISGDDEARLTYQGIYLRFPNKSEPRLVIDIGGASTELAQGYGAECEHITSEAIGSVTWTKRFFSGNTLTESRFQDAVSSAEEILKKDIGQFGSKTWDQVYGSSGIISALSLIIKGSAIDPNGHINRHALFWILQKCISSGSLQNLDLPNLSDDRRKIFAGGLSALIAAVRIFDIDRIIPVSGATRAGLMHQLIQNHEGLPSQRRSRIEALQKKYNVDIKQCNRISKLSRQLLAKLEVKESESVENMLHDASALHEIGRMISANNIGKHSAYILDNLKIENIEPKEQSRLTNLIRLQRGKLRRLQSWRGDLKFQHALLCFRLALIFGYARKNYAFKGIELSNKEQEYRITASPEWIQRSPHIVWLLQQEAHFWERIGISITLKSNS